MDNQNKSWTCFSICRRRFDSHLTGANPIVADLRVSVYNTVMANGDFETFGHLQKLLRSPD